MTALCFFRENVTGFDGPMIAATLAHDAYVNLAEAPRDGVGGFWSDVAYQTRVCCCTALELVTQPINATARIRRCFMFQMFRGALRACARGPPLSWRRKA
jgi:hypothetical protein